MAASRVRAVAVPGVGRVINRIAPFLGVARVAEPEPVDPAAAVAAPETEH